MTETLIAISKVLRPAAGLLLVFLWWPLRKTRLLASVPWIVLYFAVLDEARRWNVTTTGRLLQEGQKHAEGSPLEAYDFLVFISFLNQVRFFLIALMVAINLAFLLEQIAPLNRFQAFWARQQRFQLWLGLSLLLLMIAPALIAKVGLYLLR